MFRTRFLCLLLAACLLLSVGAVANAAEVDCDATYCFTSADFSEKEALTGICITGLPDSKAGTVLLGSRVIRSGDILTTQQLAQLTFRPLRTETDKNAVVTYLPIYENRVEKATTMTIAIHGKEDKAPVSQNSSIETYKNLSNKGKLSVTDPEGEQLTFTVTKEPKRGSISVHSDGTFTYTPKKNKVGVDSFCFTATDPAGNVSAQATVSVQILKPTDAKQYKDTAGMDCRFAAEWMRNTGLFVGEKIGGEECFYPEKVVTRGEFLAMVVKVLDIPAKEVSDVGMPQDTPNWLKPYLTAAIRSGLTAGWPETASGSFGADIPISGAEAAVMLQNALDLSISQETLEAMETSASVDESIPAWAVISLTAMAENGVLLNANETITRGQMANLMYTISHLAPTAPGTAVFRMQK